MRNVMVLCEWQHSESSHEAFMFINYECSWSKKVNLLFFSSKCSSQSSDKVYLRGVNLRTQGWFVIHIIICRYLVWIYFVFSGHPFEPTCWHAKPKPKGESSFFFFSHLFTSFCMFSDFRKCCRLSFCTYRNQCCYFYTLFSMLFLYNSLLFWINEVDFYSLIGEKKWISIFFNQREL